MAANKNNPSVRQEQRKLMYQGQEYKPCMYDGRAVGKGKYMAGIINGDLIVDEKGSPVPFRSIKQS